MAQTSKSETCVAIRFAWNVATHRRTRIAIRERLVGLVAAVSFGRLPRRKSGDGLVVRALVGTSATSSLFWHIVGASAYRAWTRYCDRIDAWLA